MEAAAAGKQIEHVICGSGHIKKVPGSRSLYDAAPWHGWYKIFSTTALFPYSFSTTHDGL